jgi:hypothetical protein
MDRVFTLGTFFDTLSVLESSLYSADLMSTFVSGEKVLASEKVGDAEIGML